MFQTNVEEKIKTHILCSITFFFPENRAVYDIMWKHILEPGHAIDDNMELGLCILDTLGYKLTLTICNTHCFSTATMAAGTVPQSYVTCTLPVSISCNEK